MLTLCLPVWSGFYLPSLWGEMPMPFGNVGARDEVAYHGGLKMAGVVGRYAALSVMVTA
jgi:hypothetical protein